MHIIARSPHPDWKLTLALETLPRRGQVLLATVNEATIVPFVSQQLGNLELALAIARRGNLPGAEALVGQNFERLFSQGQFKEAAEAAAQSPQVHIVYSRINIDQKIIMWLIIWTWYRLQARQW